MWNAVVAVIICMSTSEPIKELNLIGKMKKFYLEKNELRNYTLFTVGINTALRISDLLNLKWGDVYNFENKKFKSHIKVLEQKTHKKNIISINKNTLSALSMLKSSLNNVDEKEYIFKSRKGINRPISRIQAFRIIKKAAKEIGIEENISCHSLRKTFGYWTWKHGIAPAVIMDIFNHSSFEITKIYLCVNQDDRDEVFNVINL